MLWACESWCGAALGDRSLGSKILGVALEGEEHLALDLQDTCTPLLSSWWSWR